MADLNIIWSNNVLKKMASLGVSETEVLDVFNKGETEKSSLGGLNAIKKYPGREIGVYYNRKPSGEWIIISVWKRDRR